VDFCKYKIAAYNAIHGTSFESSDITKINGYDLGVKDTDKYLYILTYSFPCQDLSNAGKRKGMNRGGGTRSGLLWEVERLLNETAELPQVLIMENVTAVHDYKNIQQFSEWISFLETKGYISTYKDLNAKDYGIPQNRDRCFMVSLLGEYYYTFPEPIPLTETLKNRLQDNADEKYYLSEESVKMLLRSSFNQNKSRIMGGGIAEPSPLQTIKDRPVSQTIRVSGKRSVDRHRFDIINE